MTSIKKLEEKLDKKKARLQKLVNERSKIEIKIKGLRSDIEKMQAIQFEQFKKAARKENIEIRVDDIPEILQLIKNFQQDSSLECEGETEESTDATSFRTDAANKNVVPRNNSLRIISSLESIESLE